MEKENSKKGRMQIKNYCWLLYGEREQRKGECQFFLNPGEYLESGFNKIHTLEENDCLLLKAKTSFTDGDVQRKFAVYHITNIIVSNSLDD